MHTDDAGRSSGSGRAILFLIVEGVASLGGAMAIYALEIWIYLSTGSYSLFATVALLGALPGVLISPLVGPLLDRLPRGGILLSCALSAIALSLLCTWALSEGGFDVGVAAALVVGLATIQTIRWPTLLSTVSTLAAPGDIARVTAYEESVEAAIFILAPLIGVWVLHRFGIQTAAGVIAIAYACSALGTLALRLPLSIGPAKAIGILRHYADNFREEVGFGFRWIRQRRHMLRLLAYVCILNFGTHIYVTMQSPLGLTLFDAGRVAMVSSAGGVGLALGGLLVALKGGVHPPLRAIHLGTLGIISGIAIYGLSSLFWQCVLGAFLFAFFHPMVNSAMQLIWRTETPIEHQGAIFAVRRMFTSALGPLGIAASIPLSEHIVGPAARAAGEWIPLAPVWPNAATMPLGATLVVVASTMAAVALYFRRNAFLEPVPQPDGPPSSSSPP